MNSTTTVYSNERFDVYIVGKKKNRVLAVDRDRCKGCGVCISVCPYDALHFSNSKTEHGYFFPVENGKCVACRECVLACPDFALSLHALDEVTLKDEDEA